MIRTALEFVKKELEAYLIERDSNNYTAGSVISLEALSSPDGKVNLSPTINLSISLVGIEEERREGKRPYYVPTDDKKFLRLNPPVELDLYILICAHISDYPTALRDISNVIAFFQSNPLFDETRFPNLNADAKEPDKKPWELIERVSFKLHSMGFEQQNNMWSMIGSKYIPSVVYKANMLTVFDTKGKDKAAAITELNLKEN